MRLFLITFAAGLSLTPGALRADATIRYKIETSSIAAMPSGLGNSTTVVYMKGNKGATMSGGSATIIDFAKQQVTMVDTARKKYATIPASEYGSRIEAIMPDAGAGPGGIAADILKSMKTTCDSKNPGVSEVIQGVQTEERDVTCTTTMTMPSGSQQQGPLAPSMNMKFVMKIWSALPIERMRVPALWELSGYELWQKYFMNPFETSGKMAPMGMGPMFEAISKDQSVALRTSMEMYMDMPSFGTAGAASNTPLMKMTNEVVELSVAPLDDSLFSIPADCSAAPFGDVMNGLTQAIMDSAKAPRPASGDRGRETIPANIKAYVPSLTPLSRARAVAPPGAKDIQGVVELLVTVGPKGNVEGAEALSGPQQLRMAAIEAVGKWTFRPVIRDGAPVMAYTDASIDFIDGSKVPAPAQFMRDMEAAIERHQQLEEALPRTPQQVFEDLEQDAGGGDKSRRYNLLGPLAMAAVKAGANEKAGLYATELIASAQSDIEGGKKGWNYGNAIHDGHLVLGLVALRKDDVSTARRELLEAGKTPGSPQLNSFGPNMMLANELLERGERETVLEYLDLCWAFWKMGGKQLDSWSEAVRKNDTPFFGGSLR